MSKAIRLPISPKQATETVEGIIRIATQAEVDSGTDAITTVTPVTLSVALLGIDISGKVDKIGTDPVSISVPTTTETALVLQTTDGDLTNPILSITDNVDNTLLNVNELGELSSGGMSTSSHSTTTLLQSSTTAQQPASRIETSWITSTHATRKAQTKFYVSDYLGEHEVLNLDSTGGGIPDGTAAVPGLYFLGRRNTGMFRTGTSVGIAGNGSVDLTLGSTIGCYKEIRSANYTTGFSILNTSGANAPVYVYRNDPNSGMGNVGVGTVALFTNSVRRLRIESDGTISLGFSETVVNVKHPLMSSTTQDQDAFRQETSWTDPTHATRSAKTTFYVSDFSGETEVMSLSPTETVINNTLLVDVGNTSGHKIGSLNIDYVSSHNPSISSRGSTIHVSAILSFRTNSDTFDIVADNSHTADLRIGHARSGDYGIELKTTNDVSDKVTRLRVGGGLAETIINIPNLPTSSAGLSTGDIWNNAGVLSIA